jgi:hypothetical protein
VTSVDTRSQGCRRIWRGEGLQVRCRPVSGTSEVLRLREEDGRLRFELGGNFLVRSRRHWLDEETPVAVLDAPSDERASFPQHGFVGMEQETVLATRSWIKTGVVPAGVRP